MAFTPAESKCASIVTDEGDAFAGVAGLRAEIARLDPVLRVPISIMPLQKSNPLASFQWIEKQTSS